MSVCNFLVLFFSSSRYSTFYISHSLVIGSLGYGGSCGILGLSHRVMGLFVMRRDARCEMRVGWLLRLPGEFPMLWRMASRWCREHRMRLVGAVGLAPEPQLLVLRFSPSPGESFSILLSQFLLDLRIFVGLWMCFADDCALVMLQSAEEADDRRRDWGTVDTALGR